MFHRQVKDTERRLNILYDHINNEDVLSQETLESMLELSKGLFAFCFIFGSTSNVLV